MDARIIFEEGKSLARAAAEHDKNGDVASALLFYSEAIEEMQKAFQMDRSLRQDTTKQALCNNCKRRVEVLREQSQSLGFQQGSGPAGIPVQTTAQQQSKALSSGESCMEQALVNDEAGNLSKALDLYTEAVGVLLKGVKDTTDDSVKKKLNERARQALERAETLKKLLAEDGKDSKQSASPVTTSRAAPTTRYISPSSSLTTQPTQHTRHPVASLSSAARSSAPSGGQLTPSEIQLLKKSSNINGRVYLPWIEQDEKTRFYYMEPYTDPDGLVPLARKQKDRIARWARPSQFCKDPKMFYLISHQSIRQTLISDCSFVASLAICALYERRFKKRLITSCIYPKDRSGHPIYNSSGKYMIKLKLNGISRKVVIDDLLPVGHDSALLCSFSTHREELWVSLVEKAYMKVMGGYQFPGSNSNNDLHALTGWLPERVGIRTRKDELASVAQYDRMLHGLHRGDCLITVATGELSESAAERAGLVPTHAYAVLDMQHVKGYRLLLVKNPWMHLRWKGKFSENDDASWTPELEKLLNYDREIAKRTDNGVFWINWESLLHFFDVIYMNWNPDLFANKCIVHSTWQADQGPKKDAYSLANNPQWVVEVNSPEDGKHPVWVLLSKHITQKKDFEENKDFITVHIFKTDGSRVYYPDGMLVEGIRINSVHYLAKLNGVPRGRHYYSVVVSQYEKNNSIDYTLEVYSSAVIHLRAVSDDYRHTKEVKGEWTKDTAGGCANHRSFAINPVYSFALNSSSPSSVLIQLKAPRQYAVGFVVQADPSSSDAVKFGRQTSGDFRPGFCILQLKQVPPGRYTITPSTFLPGKEGPFVLSVSASSAVTLAQLK